ncbi:hypothetical protein K458DRAFT_85911 [Lentithecium fluviatile CBS 122367]|uniref:Uncharacterized protein n=1 Tax=Lentithecium fluviatile CBS 122367 TaxID=1168545 RepID=A0A6G1IS64_9PLEO|nr:hypothetical protein K458DRAFT_85911 [Lentithecium fluviatile CBS 122367]
MLQNGSGSNLTACEKGPSARSCDGSLIKSPHGPSYPVWTLLALRPPSTFSTRLGQVPCCSRALYHHTNTYTHTRTHTPLALSTPSTRAPPSPSQPIVARRPRLPSIVCPGVAILARQRQRGPRQSPRRSPRPAFLLHFTSARPVPLAHTARRVTAAAQRSLLATRYLPLAYAHRQHVHPRNTHVPMRPHGHGEGGLRDLEKRQLRRPQHQERQARRKV